MSTDPQHDPEAPRLAVIGGTGVTGIEALADAESVPVTTPFGEPSAPLVTGRIDAVRVVFLQRHGIGHVIEPHNINYRANLYALRETGVREIVAIAAVGGIAEHAGPGRLVIPDQLIDYTYGREHTFSTPDTDEVLHIDFTTPYSECVRERLLAAGAELDLLAQGTYAATQGPRLETAAEVRRLERDGCSIVGMTGMPEASLARELALDYACCAVVVNRAAGKEGAALDMDSITAAMQTGMLKVNRLLQNYALQLA